MVSWTRECIHWRFSDDLISRGMEEPTECLLAVPNIVCCWEKTMLIRDYRNWYKLGIVGEDRWRTFNEKIESTEIERQRLKTTWIQPNSETAEKISSHVNRALSREYNLFELLKRPEINYDLVSSAAEKIDPIVGEQLEIEAKYSGYIENKKMK